MSKHAERNAPFIRWFIRALWGDHICYDVDTENDIDQVPDNQQGMFIFYIESDEAWYPIYIGITSRNFRVRFYEHFKTKTGVIYQLPNGGFVIPRDDKMKNLRFKAALIPHIFPIEAKMMESILLEAFDFCFNVEENGGIRMMLDIGSQIHPKDSRHYFDKHFGNVMKEMKIVLNKYDRGTENHGQFN